MQDILIVENIFIMKWSPLGISIMLVFFKLLSFHPWPLPEIHSSAHWMVASISFKEANKLAQSCFKSTNIFSLFACVACHHLWVSRNCSYSVRLPLSRSNCSSYDRIYTWVQYPKYYSDNFNKNLFNYVHIRMCVCVWMSRYINS